MRKVLMITAALVLSAALFYPNPALADRHVYGGGALGWALDGPAKDAHKGPFVYGWAGLEIMSDSAGDVKLIGCYQYLNLTGTEQTAHGGRLILASKLFGLEGSILADVGVLDNYAVEITSVDQKGSITEFVEKDALTFGGGISWPVAKYVSAVLYLQAFDRGDLDSDVIVSLSLSANKNIPGL